MEIGCEKTLRRAEKWPGKCEKKSPQNKFFILFDLFTLQFIYSETRQGRKSCQWFLTTLK